MLIIKNKRYRILLVVILGILSIPLLVLALNTWDTGYRVNTGDGAQKIYIDSSNTCKEVTNNSGKDIFVPTKTAVEWNAFNTNKPSGISVSDCGIQHYDSWQGYSWEDQNPQGSAAAALAACNHYWFDGNYCYLNVTAYMSSAQCNSNAYTSVCFDSSKNPYYDGSYLFPGWYYEGCWHNYCAGWVVSAHSAGGTKLGDWY